ncbi:MAG: glycosyltransferase family 2 protein, partial [bacterium]
MSVVIPNWNGRALLEVNVPAVLAELERARAAGRAAELIVVDDGSTDDSAAWLRRAHPQVRVIERARNGGFAAACNLGVRAAAGEIVYLLNSDAEFLPGALSTVPAAFEAPDVFAMASLEERGWWPIGDLRGRGQAPPLRARYIRAPLPGRTPVLFASGGHAAFRRSMFLELGGFDERYAPFYWEDIDLCWRARRRGWRILLDPRSRVRHAGGGSLLRAAGRVRRWAIRRRNAARFSRRLFATAEDRETARAWLSRLSAAAPAGVLRPVAWTLALG